jgi:hypothetical protein
VPRRGPPCRGLLPVVSMGAAVFVFRLSIGGLCQAEFMLTIGRALYRTRAIWLAYGYCQRTLRALMCGRRPPAFRCPSGSDRPCTGNRRAGSAQRPARPFVRRAVEPTQPSFNSSARRSYSCASSSTRARSLGFRSALAMALRWSARSRYRAARSPLIQATRWVSNTAVMMHPPCKTAVDGKYSPIQPLKGSLTILRSQVGLCRPMKSSPGRA